MRVQSFRIDSIFLTQTFSLALAPDHELMTGYSEGDSQLMKTGLRMNSSFVVKKRGPPESRSLKLGVWCANAKLARNRHVGSVGVFILCVNLWRYFHLMGSPILTLWEHG